MTKIQPHFHDDENVVLFPISRDPKDDITITREEAIAQGVSFRRVCLIADALRFRRHRALASGKDALFNAIQDNHPNAILSISNDDLRRIEKPPTTGSALYLHLWEAGHTHGSERYLPAGRVSTILSRISPLIRGKTDGRVGIGFHESHIVLLETEEKNFALKVGERLYEVLAPYGQRTTMHNLHYASPLPNEVLSQIASAGMAGVAIDKLVRKYRPDTLRAQASRTNRYFGVKGYPWLSITTIDGRIYIFDCSLESHRLEMNRLKLEARVISKEKTLSPSTNAQRYIEGLTAVFQFCEMGFVLVAPLPADKTPAPIRGSCLPQNIKFDLEKCAKLAA